MRGGQCVWHSLMETPESRLNAATACGIVRDGHEMALVRLDDLKGLCGAAYIYEREGKIAREQRDEARRFAEAYREVWEMVSTAVDQTPNPDPLPWK
jgi:hypothetical protein